jgi:hypothetical protein
MEAVPKSLTVCGLRVEREEGMYFFERGPCYLAIERNAGVPGAWRGECRVKRDDGRVSVATKTLDSPIEAARSLERLIIFANLESSLGR